LDRILESLASGPSYQRENHAGPSQPYRATKGFAAVAPTFMAILFEFGERILILQSPMDAIRLDDPAWGKKEAQIDALGDNVPPGEAIAWIKTQVLCASGFSPTLLKAWDWACRHHVHVEHPRRIH
jgi:hypothetical protein